MTSEIYAEIDREKAREIVGELGCGGQRHSGLATARVLSTAGGKYNDHSDVRSSESLAVTRRTRMRRRKLSTTMNKSTADTPIGHRKPQPQTKRRLPNKMFLSKDLMLCHRLPPVTCQCGCWAWA